MVRNLYLLDCLASAISATENKPLEGRFSETLLNWVGAVQFRISSAACRLVLKCMAGVGLTSRQKGYASFNQIYGELLPAKAVAGGGSAGCSIMGHSIRQYRLDILKLTI